MAARKRVKRAILAFRVTRDELRALKRDAERQGMSLADYGRMRCGLVCIVPAAVATSPANADVTGLAAAA